MKTLLTLPPTLANCFHGLTNLPADEYFCTSDPIDRKLGSGGGSVWLLQQCQKAEGAADQPFETWLSQEKRLLIHAGGQSRRLPAYAPCGKSLLPMPVIDWQRGLSLDQTLLDLQLPLYKQLMEKAPGSLHTLIASGDVLIRTQEPMDSVPEADVVCYGIWATASQATHHGVFVMSRQEPGQLDRMLQKPTTHELEALVDSHLYLLDTGLWLLSDRAVELLREQATKEDTLGFYDLYGCFGHSLGIHPLLQNEELKSLRVAVVPLDNAQFYHYGTSHEMLESTLKLQQWESDQRKVLHRRVRPNMSITVQNALTEVEFTPANDCVWIENSHIGPHWQLGTHQIITGVPWNNWSLKLPNETCLDIVPVGESNFAVRPYGYYDDFRGSLIDAEFMGISLAKWLVQRQVSPSLLGNYIEDIQLMKLFPVTDDLTQMELLIRWMTNEPTLERGKQLWESLPRLSADELSQKANLTRLVEQRKSFQKKILPLLEKRYNKSIFYQLDLKEVAKKYQEQHLPLPDSLPETADAEIQIHSRMLRSRLFELQGNHAQAASESKEAFASLRKAMLNNVLEERIEPQLCVLDDQIVWGRCPVRIDLAGGWTDTPPYSLYEGGNVVNIAIELNGQPPLQVYVKPCKEPHIVLRSIDMGAMEVVEDYAQLEDYQRIGSPFSIPKAALVLAGFSPLLQRQTHATLRDTLLHFGSGMELTLLAAIPAGSGLGTSSILAATVLGALNDFCGLEWDKNKLCQRTLVLEQLLTTGGGWQDQYGGVLQGVKLLQTQAGPQQSPAVSWLPDMLFTQPDYQACHLLYYTGLTRVAKNILGEIVQNMFLNAGPELRLLAQMKHHALSMAQAIQQGNFTSYGALVAQTWQQNQRLDAGTNPPQVQEIIRLVQDYTLGLKLPGAGGGGYLYMVAKDAGAAQRIRSILTQHTPNERARFVDMSLSHTGFQVTKS